MAYQMESPVLNEEKLHNFVGSVLNDFGACLTTTLAHLGDRLGIFKAMSDSCSYTSEDLAAKTGLTERYLREWLLHMAAANYLIYEGAGRYRLPAEHAVALTDESSPFHIAGGFQAMHAMIHAEPRIRQAFQDGSGMLWGEHHHDLFQGTERFFRTGYASFLVQQWIPALDGVQEKLEKGAVVADVGCGHAASTMVMAKAYPNSRFYGFDYHEPSIERARQVARDEGVSERTRFEVADCTSFPDHQYDFIAFFDCFHDLADPVGAARRAARTLADGGTVMLVEPMAGESIESNLNPVGRVFSGASVLCCTPNAIAGGGQALGTVASDADLATAATEGGLRDFKRVTETPFNRIFQARK